MTTNRIKCQCCGRDITTEIDNVKLTLARRGDRAAYLCKRCATTKRGYTIENGTFHGTVKVNQFTFSTEDENTVDSDQARVEMSANNFIATSDCTVKVEYKSPIYRGLNAMAKHRATIDRLTAAGLLSNEDQEFVNDYGERKFGMCGTHCHVGEANWINGVTMGYIRRFYHSLFVPLCEAMQADSAKTARFFGRDFGRWAEAIDSNSWAMNHSNFINVEHDVTIEFRINKHINARQYMNAVKFEKRVVEIIINNFLAHFNDEDFDKSRYATIKEYRIHKAQVAGQKIVKAYEKASASC